jgi:hypothetical protein
VGVSYRDLSDSIPHSPREHREKAVQPTREPDAASDVSSHGFVTTIDVVYSKAARCGTQPVEDDRSEPLKPCVLTVCAPPLREIERAVDDRCK